jgi:anti-sigma B factor antagonist
LSVTVQSDGTVLRLFAAGEIDMSTSGKFRDPLKMALGQRPKTLVVDLAGVSFMDSTGIGALAYAHTQATEDAAGPTTLNVINCQPAVQRVLDVTGLLPVLTNSDGPPHRPCRVRLKVAEGQGADQRLATWVRTLSG